MDNTNNNWFDGKSKYEMPKYIKWNDGDNYEVHEVLEWDMLHLTAKTKIGYCYISTEKEFKFSKFQYYPATKDEYDYFVANIKNCN